MNFLHKTTRLGCDLGRAFRFLTKPDMIKKWSNLDADISMKKGGHYTLTSSEDAVLQLNTSGSVILDYEREKYLHIEWKDANESYDLLIRFMQCTYETEFCTEMHLMFKHMERSLSELEVESYNDLFETLLEELRKYQNKDWVIQDSDLSMSYLKGSKL